MPTYFIRANLPIDSGHRIQLAYHHLEKTGNQLSVINNGAGTECLIKVNCDHAIEDVLPAGFVATDVITDIETARALLNSAGWTQV